MDIIVPFEKLLFYSQSYANRLLARCSTIVASDIDSLVAQINVISKNQHEINLLQFSLSKATYLGNMANFAKSKHLLVRSVDLECQQKEPIRDRIAISCNRRFEFNYRFSEYRYRFTAPGS
jgi:hypothetical protein